MPMNSAESNLFFAAALRSFFRSHHQPAKRFPNLGVGSRKLRAALETHFVNAQSQPRRSAFALVDPHYRGLALHALSPKRMVGRQVDLHNQWIPHAGHRPVGLVPCEQNQNVAAAHLLRDGGQSPRTRPRRSDPALQVDVESSVSSSFHLKNKCTVLWPARQDRKWVARGRCPRLIPAGALKMRRIERRVNTAVALVLAAR